MGLEDVLTARALLRLMTLYCGVQDRSRAHARFAEHDDVIDVSLDKDTPIPRPVT